MQITVRLGHSLRAHVDAPELIPLQLPSPPTARAAVDALVHAHPNLRPFILDDAARLRPHVNLFINDELIHDRLTLADHIAHRDRIHILPAVSGGTDPTAHTVATTQPGKEHHHA